jgi:hypothetical protein
MLIIKLKTVVAPGRSRQVGDALDKEHPGSFWETDQILLHNLCGRNFDVAFIIFLCIV